MVVPRSPIPTRSLPRLSAATSDRRAGAAHVVQSVDGIDRCPVPRTEFRRQHFPLGFTTYNPGSGLPPALQTDTLYSDDSDFPLQAGPPGSQPHVNNDFTISATYWGLQQWSVGNTSPATRSGNRSWPTRRICNCPRRRSTVISGFDSRSALLTPARSTAWKLTACRA